MSDLFVHGPLHGSRATQIGGTPVTPRQPSAPDDGRSPKRKQSKDYGPSQLSKLVRGAGDTVLSWRDGLSASAREDKRRVEERRQILVARMRSAATLKDWEAAAIELDRLEGNDEWKLDDASGGYEYSAGLIRAKLRELDNARANSDISTMMYLIRTALSRDVGGMGNTDLYRHSYVGTKALIERYVDSAIKTIESVVERSVFQTELDARELLDGMVFARQSFGRSALLLSGGATFGMAHIGVLKTLYEQKLLPRIISGASAGSIVCAVTCTRKDDELPSLIKEFPFGDLGVFEAANENISSHLRHLLTKGSWSDISHLTRVMRDWLGDVTFTEAYNRTRRICNICVSSSSIYELPRLLNYITAPNVLIWSAVAASCSVPLVFQSHPLLMKDPKTGAHEPWIPSPQQFIDGSVDNDLPMTRLAEMFNVNHFIVSQVNPHVVPFLTKDEQAKPKPGKIGGDKSPERTDSWWANFSSIAKDEGLHRMHFAAELGIFPNLLTKLLSVLSQKYSGDITILPEITLSDLPLVLKNPTPEFMLRNCLIGERATWPKLSRIRDRLAVELALDQAVHALRTRVVFSRSQVNLRRAMGVWQPFASRPSAGSAGRLGGHDSGELMPPGSGLGDFGGRGGADADVSPTEERTFGMARRRGSGASIQLVVARHRRRPPLQEEDEEEDEDEEAERDVADGRAGRDDDDYDEDDDLELRVRRRRRTSTSTTRLNRLQGGAGALRPRLKRNAKSHSHMRRGTTPGEFFPWSGRSEGTTVAMEEDGVAAAATGGGGNGGAGLSSPSPSPFASGLGIVSLSEGEGGGSSQASDGGLQSDTDPYARNGESVVGAGSPRREQPSKLRYSET